MPNLTLVEPGEQPKDDNVYTARFGIMTISEQLRLIADNLEQERAAGAPDHDYMVIVFGNDDLRDGMSVQIGGTKRAHPYLLVGMLQNAILCGLDEAAEAAYLEPQEGD